MSLQAEMFVIRVLLSIPHPKLGFDVQAVEFRLSYNRMTAVCTSLGASVHTLVEETKALLTPLCNVYTFACLKEYYL